MKKLRIIVGGFLGLMPAGGVTWDYVQYPVGFMALGHDVYYIEDSGLYPIYSKNGADWNDASFCVEYLSSVMDYFGMSDRWAYRDGASGRCFGMTEAKVREITGTADVFVNVSCSTVMREEYSRIPARVLIDTDPMFTQIQYLSEQGFTPGESGTRRLIDKHNFHFTFGENIGAPDCRIPDCGVEWLPTRQPICLDHWRPSVPSGTGSFTTLMNWADNKILLYDGDEWGQKDIEFQRFIGLPLRAPTANFSIAVNQTKVKEIDAFPVREIEKHGWTVKDPDECAEDLTAYQRFLSDSLGEFSVAKNTYVKGLTGWFSCRSACYLASGRPVITQDTGWTRNIPTGLGLFAFNNLEEATDAIGRVLSEPEMHSRGARRIAEEYFDSKIILGRLLDQLT